MRVEKLNNRIIKYRLYDEKSGGVVYYTLDLDKYSLSISGEITAEYKWTETPQSESFIKLMLRCSRWYLLNKLFAKVFDLEKSIVAVQKWIEEKEYFVDDDEAKIDCFEAIAVICTRSDEAFMQSVIKALDDYGVEIDGDTEYLLWNRIEKSYKYWAEKSVDLFCEQIKPELEKEL